MTCNLVLGCGNDMLRLESEMLGNGFSGGGQPEAIDSDNTSLHPGIAFPPETGGFLDRTPQWLTRFQSRDCLFASAVATDQGIRRAVMVR